MESFLSFRFRTYDEFVGKNGENLNEEDTNHSHNQFPDDETSDDEFFDVDSNKEDEETIVANSAHNSLHLEDLNQGNNSVFIKEIVGSSFSDNSLNVEETEEHSSEPNSEAENSPIVSDLGENSEEKYFKIAEKTSDSAKDVEKNNNAHLFSSDDEEDDDNESLVSDSDSDSMVSSSKFSFENSIIDSMSDGFLSDIDFERAFEVDTSMENLNKEYENGENQDDEKQKQTTTFSVGPVEPENSEKPNLDGLDFEVDTSMENLNTEYENGEEEDKETKLEGENKNQTTTPSVGPAEPENGEKPNLEEQLGLDFEDENELERQWEHQDLVEQLKMEIKKVKAIGLPTILEESVTTPKITEDLKPWKIEEKFEHEDTLDELHKFYKSYRERMRKLDILNYQKMYAIGFLKLKDPLESLTKNKLSNPSMAATVLSIHCFSCTGKSATEVEQPLKMKKLSRELQRDLEKVYVGQMCLSWEFLRWEYGKALKIWESDLHGIRRYNEVADKFQQFQVLIIRFLEDEPFQGYRVNHYAKTRCVLRNLLQVPVIREDDLSDNTKKERKRGSSKDVVTSVKLVEIIEESIRIMWKFIRSDKYNSNPVLVKACGRSNVELQNPSDAVLLDQLRSALQKKEKRLKELTRSENCILRKIRKHQNLEDGTDRVRYFFSEVDLKLVSRVLNMSKISSEQLGWCSDKLNKINVVSGKLYYESSFLLFPS